MSFAWVDPCTGELVERYPLHGNADMDEALATLTAEQVDWAAVSATDRCAALSQLAVALDASADTLAEVVRQEVGKPTSEAVAEVRKCAWVCRYYAERADAWLMPEPHASDGRAEVRHVPLGVVLAVMPWNFPLWQFFRFAAPAWAAGNAVLLKHAPNVPRCALAIADICTDLPMRSVRVDEAGVRALIADDRVAAVTFTGSTRAGAAIARASGEALKKTVLELGGSDPFVVLSDADIDRAAEVGAASRLLNAGQSCIAAKRFIVVESAAGAFVERLGAHLQDAVVGDPASANTTVGPLARRDLRAALHRQVEASVARGARVVFGGEIPEGPGFFYPVTLILDVGRGMPVWDEEVFGPVAVVRVAADEHEALDLANDTVFGLGASVWTADDATAERFAAGVRAGAVFINGLVKSDPRLPFGGVGRSGYGRELGRDGLLEFVARVTIWFPL